MKLDVKELASAPFGQEEQISIELYKERIDDELMAERTKGILKLVKLEDEILGKFEGSSKVKMFCDRCLAEFMAELPLKFSQEYLLRPRKEPDEERLRVEKGFQIDIAEPLRQEILTKIPTKKLCKESCAGICSYCGSDLNTLKCRCKGKAQSKKENSDK